MKNKQWINILVVAMSLATAWAIRGQFGHEQGAAWAGGIGALALVLVSGRKEWYNKMLLIALASAVGWGAGGMISYGRVVGYGRADNFINSFYGLSMLFVIGALFGLLGGGLSGLVLDDVKDKKVKWGRLMAEMTAGGAISYFFFVEQLGFLMTPPRSEAWAVILGAGLAMLWFMAREGRNSAIRVAVFAALGGGFGFGFGNFLQIVGNVLEINFNMWNVMEYSIGFFGGTGMAYGVFSSVWPEEEENVPPARWTNFSAFLIVIVLFPLIVYRESLRLDHFLQRLGDIPNLESIAAVSTEFVVVLLFVMMAGLYLKLRTPGYGRNDVRLTFYVYLLVYMIVSYLITGLFAGHTALNHHLYLLNALVIYLLSRKDRPAMLDTLTDKVEPRKWFGYLILIIVVLAVLSLILINIHGPMSGGHNRFPVS